MTPPEPPTRDWVLVIFIVALGCALAIGLGLVGAGAISMAGARSPGPGASTTATATTPGPTPTPTVVQPTSSLKPRNVGEAVCDFADFPLYPGSTRIGNPTAYGRRWWVNTYPTQVADYYSAGTGPTEWLFRLEPIIGSPWRFRMTRPPACHGFLTVLEDPSGGTRYEAIPDGY